MKKAKNTGQEKKRAGQRPRKGEAKEGKNAFPPSTLHSVVWHFAWEF